LIAMWWEEKNWTRALKYDGSLAGSVVTKEVDC